MPTFTSNDAQINYQTFGDASKPALVFSIHWVPNTACGSHRLRISSKIIT